ncbi:hypothetical protein GOBAR_DD34644 [Gossypium barbadense]|nr:hypothetical protein GOBAR_DD34644 [Gossypium barbadense]
MQLSPTSVSSSKRSDFRRKSGSRLRQKHKRLDAICEEEYNRNHGEGNKRDDVDGSGSADFELRRSSRVRKAPLILDVSPPPPRRRQKIRKNERFVRGGRNLGSVKQEEEEETITEALTLGSWRSRLRTRRKNVNAKVKVEERVLSRRKLFEDIGGEMVALKSRRLGSIEASSGSQSEEKVEICGMEEETELEKEEIKGDGVVEAAPVLESKTNPGNNRDDEVVEGPVVLESEMSHGNGKIIDGNADEVDKDDREVSNCMQSEECIGHEILEVTGAIERVELTEERVQQLECLSEGANEEDAVEVDNGPEEVEDVGLHDAKEDGLVNGDKKHSEFKNHMKVEKSNQAAAYMIGKSRIKQGRRCGLCGGGTDGKPPKKLVHDAGDSENEAYSTSASEEPDYDIWDGFGDEPGWLGRLLGPINDRYGIAGIWVHQQCAVWSPEVYFAGLGCLKKVRAALCRGRALKCSRCGRPGATIGCRVDRCPKTYHLPCARANGCIFDHRKFLIACTDHRYLFQPHGIKYLAQIKKMKAKKMKLEMRKLSNDAWRKDIEAEEKWLEHCGEDEEFLKREGKRLHRDLLRLAPVYIGGSESENGKSFEGWESVAGLHDVIQCMKEVVILPLLYPEFFDNLGLTPPRGVLLHGYPGTGKTLVVRALIGSCARGDKRIAYFARKGADCLGKYVGDAERQLRLLFQVAERCQPSIIFIDEIDGLAPRRTRQQDQTHSSVVSTLLALLDGLKSRGSVVVIGATNRPDAVDPALRRPGRFDREIYFPLPSMEDRAAILELHTKRWPKPVTGSLLKWVARKTIGFAGADLQALCTQAAVISLKRNFPLQEILSTAEEKTPGAKCVPLHTVTVEERDWLEALSCSPPPCSRREAGMATQDLVASPLPTHLIPCLLEPLSTLLVSLHLDERLWLPPLLSKGGAVIESVVVSVLQDKRLPKDHWWFHVHDLLQDSEVSGEIERRLSHAGMLIGEFSFTDYDMGDVSDNGGTFEPSIVRNSGTCSSLSRNTYFTSTRKTGFRILIAGSPRSGQKHLAACLLHCFIGNIEIQKFDISTIAQEGNGDLIYGVTQILMKCASMGSSVLFMPRIDLWVVETTNQVSEESSSPSTFHQTPMEEDPQLVEKENGSSLQYELAGTAQATASVQSVSHAWSSFVEQVESICVSTSLIIVETEVANNEEFTMQNTNSIDLNKKDDHCASDHEGKLDLFEDAAQGIGISGNTTSEEHHNSSVANQLIVHVDKQNGATPGPCGSESTRNPTFEGELTMRNMDWIDLNKMDANGAPSQKGKIVAVDKAVDHISLGGNTISVEHHNYFAANDPVFLVDKQNGSNPGPSGSESPRNPVVEGDPESSKQSNGFAPNGPVLSENGFCSSDELDGAKLPASAKACDTETTITSEDGKPTGHERKEVPNFSSSETALPTESVVTCFYHCCSDCLHSLPCLMQKVLLKEWKSNGSDLTVDDVHDTVALLSVDLLSTVRKLFAARYSSNKFDENLRMENPRKLSHRPDWSICQCESSENSLVIPKECSCHTVGNTSPNIQFGFDPKFVYRDGVLVPIDSNKEVSFHCKFDTLCLCSLIESILMTKQPFD